ncbi:DUF2635 domain-containing protein [Magnetospirillum molischianum]|uniref:DUF2635 domain-containing protein n=1 Tax=Magnetospirillum molischianum DSM 120 TaxID=1150626 RepID=H8FUZ5_MAGML|nr:DUF2635 domain-containing protein [Magnetospirillum molischianum]CCG42183.1 conserved hypothetical protein [Magnetospirillum molischianum DSM 120]
MYVKPQAGRSVPDPERGGLLPPQGAIVPDTQYWLRRLGDNDVIAADPDVQAAKSASVKETK